MQLKLHTDFSPYVDETASEDHGDEWTQDIYDLFLPGNSLLKPLYFSRYSKKWDSVSTSLLLQSEHSQASLGSLWWPVSMAMALSTQFVHCLHTLSSVLHQSQWSDTLLPCPLFVGQLQCWFTLWFCGFIPIIDVIFFFFWDDLVWSVKCLSWRTEGFLDLCFLSLFNPWHWRGLYC